MRNVLSQVMNFIKTGLEVRAKMLLHVAQFLQHLQNLKLIKCFQHTVSHERISMSAY